MNENDLAKENQFLKDKLNETEQTLEAIRLGQADAIVVNTPQGEKIYSLVSPEHPYRIFIESMGEGAVSVSKEGLILYANKSFAEMVGVPVDKLLGSSFLDHIEENQKERFVDNLKNKKLLKQEFCLLKIDKTPLHVYLSMTVGFWNELESYCLIITNISEIWRMRRFDELSESIAKTFSEAISVDTALCAIIRGLNEFLSWEVLLLWKWSEETQKIKLCNAVGIPSKDIEEFKAASQKLDYLIGGALGKVQATYRPIVIEDVTRDPHFIRSKEAKNCGLRGALAFPIFEGSKLSGIIELFRKEPYRDSLDDLFLNFLTSFGISIGQFLKKKEDEEGKYMLASFINRSLLGIYYWDLQGIVKVWNMGAEKILGWKANEMIGQSIQKIYPPDRLHEFDEILEKIVYGQGIEHLETQGYLKSGGTIWLKMSIGPVKDELGQALGCCVVCEDITQERQIKQSVKQNEEKFRHFVETTDEWIWEIDLKGRITFSNQAVVKILGYSTEEILSFNIQSLIIDDEKDMLNNQLDLSISQKRGWKHIIYRYLHKNHSIKWLESNAMEILDLDQSIIGFRLASRDITESKNLEKLKNEFVSIVCHELRTPLTSIYASLALIVKKKLDLNVNKELVETAYRNAERLTQIIGDILDVEKFQMGTVEYNLIPLAMADVVQEAMDSVQALAKKNQVQIVKEGDFPRLQVKGDFSRLLQLMLNLLSNAIKFSPPGKSIYISMQTEGFMVRVSVRDLGPGIPEEFHSRIFQKFFQAEPSATRIHPGVGIGLSICKGIIDNHGGQIHFKTKMGEGTTFYFDIPIYNPG